MCAYVCVHVCVAEMCLQLKCAADNVLWAEKKNDLLQKIKTERIIVSGIYPSKWKTDRQTDRERELPQYIPLSNYLVLVLLRMGDNGRTLALHTLDRSPNLSFNE